MKFSRNAIYTRIASAIKAEYPDAYTTSRMVASPARFPACLIHEIDNTRPIQNTQLDFEDVQYESVYEIQVVSNEPNTAATEAYGIMALADAAFSGLYYRRFSQTNIDRGDTFTLVSRYRRIIGGGDTMPENND
jgi:hypothetical protein